VFLSSVVRFARLKRLELPSRVNPAVHMALHHEHGLPSLSSLSPCRSKDLSLFPTFTSSDISCRFRLSRPLRCCLLSIIYPLRIPRCFKSSLRTASIPPLLYLLPTTLSGSICYRAADTFAFSTTSYHNQTHQWPQVLRPAPVQPSLPTTNSQTAQKPAKSCL
jgi:hypothetical protein